MIDANIVDFMDSLIEQGANYENVSLDFVDGLAAMREALLEYGTDLSTKDQKILIDSILLHGAT